ncbi:UDP-glucose pyrophosphorylase [Loktanella fryxellensis]|uniref:UTP--glucose-1-phosphate uridylyltransferase n=1 Tax=Loktanella fryxellensis TaxID=245187 RepID=A0A1H8GLR5_9RHOB|nr:UTP--glucose-1-phosphate uridylyltransferase GalU [Loktanella fryxellensis]SEN45101.1 UDP-glucose pyrophosphorylase [Loktanella fryxellensis]
MQRPVRKAVFPVAGLGTRFLPATKAQPKEMLTIIDKPIIQFAVEEAIAAGITHLIFVIGRTKRSIADHFDANPELDMLLRSKGKDEMADTLNSIVPKDIACIYFRQAEALGLGHAVACASPVIDDDEPFAVLLADDLMRAQTPVLKQMIDLYDRTGRSVVAVEDVAPDMVSSYGIVDADLPHVGSSGRLRGVVEKPKVEDAPSNQAIVGRYILDGSIMKLLRDQTPGAGGEIQLTDAISRLVGAPGVDAYRFEGRRYDCGSKIGFVEATMASALEHPEYGDQTRQMMRDLLDRDA